jgi:hypothetical protein
MKTILTIAALLSGIQLATAQSTTGGKSGGSTASTGTGYLSEGQRPTTSNPNSMTIDDEGASRAYMYVPPTTKKNRAASPAGSDNTQPARKATSPDSLRHSSLRKRNNR